MAMKVYFWVAFTTLSVSLLLGGVGSLQEQFRNPPNEFRTLQIIHGFDGLGGDEATLRQRLEELRKMGIGGLVANVSFRDYMRSEEQWQIFQTGIRVAEQLGFTLWLYDEEGYPSGAAGDLVLERNPDFEAIGLVRVVGDNGKVSYEVRHMYEGTHCTENVYKKRRYINIINADAVREFITITHDAYAKRIPNIGKRIHAIFTDEPSLMTTYIRPPANALAALPWVEDLPKEFKRRKGYDLMPHLESLFSDVGDYRSIRCDFYEVIGQLVAERFFGQIQERCRQIGIASSGHLLAEEKLLWHVMYYGDLLACLRLMDIPGIDMLTSDPREIVVGHGFIVPKLVSSAAHIKGRYETMSETSDYVQRMGKRRAWLPEMKATACIQYLLGINTITSYYAHPFGDEQERNDYTHYNAYVGRLSVMLRNALHVCDVAVLYPIAGIWANFYPTALSMYQPHPSKRIAEIDDGFVNLCRFLLQNQIDFDIVDETAIQNAKVERGGFHVAKERYKALIVPTTDAVHIETLRRIAEMQKQGIIVVAIGETPKFAASRNESDDEVRTLSSQLFRDERWLPKADEKLVQKLRDAGFGIIVEHPNPDLWVAHYLRDGRHVYFAINVSAQPIQCILRLPKYQSVTLWLPDTGEVKETDAKTENRNTIVSLTVPSFDGVFVVCE